MWHTRSDKKPEIEQQYIIYLHMINTKHFGFVLMKLYTRLKDIAHDIERWLVSILDRQLVRDW